MKGYQLTLKLLAIGIFGVSLIHIFLGISSEVLLGSGVSKASLLDPNLDSQNRFYGAAFLLFAATFWLSSKDLVQYRNFLVAALAVFFVAGLTRVISIFVVGWPTTPILALSTIEILGPPMMYFWLQKLPMEDFI